MILSLATHSHSTKHPFTQVPTTESVKLSSHGSGIVAVKAHGLWNNLCAENLSNSTANVICHQKGYYTSARHYSGTKMELTL